MKSKLAFVLFGSILLLSCRITKPKHNPTFPLNGTWVPIAQEMSGEPIRTEVYAHHKLTINDSTYTYFAENQDFGSLKYANGKMDLLGLEGPNKDNHFKAIYVYEKNKLTICYDLSGQNYPDSIETKSNPAYFISVFKRD